MRPDVMLTFRRLRPGDDVPRQRQHVRTDSEMCVAGGSYVDFKLQLVFRDQEIDRAAVGEKIGSFAYGQHVSSLNGFEYASVVLTLRAANEKNVASAQVLFFACPANFHASAADGSSLGGLCQRGSERQRKSGDCSAEKASGGHSTNRGKAARKEAFAWYSLSLSSRPPEAGKGNTRVVSSPKKTKRRIRFFVEKRLFGARRRERRPTPNPGNRSGKHTQPSIADIARP